VAARFGDRVRFDFDTRQQFDSFVQHPLRCEHQFEIPPGNYRFKLIFRTGKDRFGGIETPLAVDPVDAAQISMSAIALSHDVQPISQDAADEAVEEGRKPLIFRGNQVMIAGSDVLPRTGNAEAYFEIYEPLAAGNEPVQLTMQPAPARRTEQPTEMGLRRYQLEHPGEVRQRRDSGRAQIAGCDLPAWKVSRRADRERFRRWRNRPQRAIPDGMKRCAPGRPRPCPGHRVLLRPLTRHIGSLSAAATAGRHRRRRNSGCETRIGVISQKPTWDS